MEEMYVKSFGMIYQVIPHGPGAKVELRSYDNPEISHRYKAEFIEEALKAELLIEIEIEEVKK